MPLITMQSDLPSILYLGLYDNFFVYRRSQARKQLSLPLFAHRKIKTATWFESTSEVGQVQVRAKEGKNRLVAYISKSRAGASISEVLLQVL